MTVAARPSIPAERYQERLEAASLAAADAGYDALLFGIGADLQYLTGYEAIETERLTMLVVGQGAGSARLVVPLLEEPAARAGCRVDVPIATWGETDDASALVASLVREAAGTDRPAGSPSPTASGRASCFASSERCPARNLDQRRPRSAGCA